MLQQLTIAVTPLCPLGNRKRQSYTYNEHKKWLYEVPGTQPVPWMMVKLCANCVNKGALKSWIRKIGKQTGKLSYEQEHGDATKDIQGQQASLWSRWSSCIVVHKPSSVVREPRVFAV